MTNQLEQAADACRNGLLSGFESGRGLPQSRTLRDWEARHCNPVIALSSIWSKHA